MQGKLVSFEGCRVFMYENGADPETMRELQEVPIYSGTLRYYAVCAFRNRQVLLTGGVSYSQDGTSTMDSSSALLLDMETGRWESDSLPRLNSDRKDHASCASDDCAYVFGGFTGIVSAFVINSTIETLSFKEERNWRGKAKSLKWKVFQIDDFQPRKDPIMTVLN